MSSRLLPPNSSLLERAIADAASFDLDVSGLCHVESAALCPPAWLPWLAWERSVDEWDDAWTTDVHRGLVSGSLELHRRKGTVWAIKTALAAIGYPVLELIEQRACRDAWLAAGGLTLDGGWAIAGTAMLNPPAGASVGQLVRRSALNHWAEYAIRLNVADGEWTREQQRKIRATAERHAPARSHLVALIAGARAEFDAGIRLASCTGRVHTRLGRCRRLSANNRLTLDGCWLLDGTDAPLSLSRWPLDGTRHTSGTAPAGQPLHHGHATFKARTRQRLRAVPGGTRRRTVMLGGDFARLDGRTRLGEATLGGWGLDTGISLASATLECIALPRLDGTWPLGGDTGQDRLWFGGTLTVHRHGITTKELI
ncbi:MAG: phage tail protein I [Laribacter sp.]|nr:phage tail protein I [Laribacter sp.]MBP9526914.1 phage tail protein I [Laribacter sp.]MBP9608451.1 phage tail protein I [Laribacter sp.]